MTESATMAAVRHFLWLIVKERRPTEEELVRALDQLAAVYHDTPAGEPGPDDPEPPPRRHNERCATLSAQFPDFGFYPLADPTAPVADNEPHSLGDAIDDLADIAGDLEEVLWRFETGGADEAHWYFRLLYQIHWGRHLRELSLYLHARLW